VQEIDLLNRQVFGASVLQWGTALLTLVGVFAALTAIRHLSLRHLSRIAAHSATRADDIAVEIVQRTRLYFLLLIAVYAATRVVPLPAEFARFFRAIAIILVLLQVGRWGNALIQVAADHYARLRSEDDRGSRATIQAMGYAARFGLWLVLLITALQNFGIDVTALITGLGIGGIAIALAVQNVLGDLFAALAIVLDKPFVVGDFIIVDTTLGTVEHVGLKTTRIRSLSGEQVIIANADLLKSRIRNYKRMEQRRAVFTFDLAFDTPPEKVSAVPAIVRKAVEAQPLARFDRCHWLSTEPTGLRIETVYYVLDPDFNKYADTQHAINLAVLGNIRDEAIDFGYHTRHANLNTADR
jgi:small-conductance mechanosensitive channel